MSEEDAPEEDDLGPPVDLGALVPNRPPPVFLVQLRRRIERRQLSADVAGLFWSLPGTLLRGLLWGMSPSQPSEIKKKTEGGDHG